MKPDYIITDGTERLIKLRAKEEIFNRIIRLRVEINGIVTWKKRGYAKLAESLGDDLDAAEKVIAVMITETTALTQEQLGEIPLILADDALWNGGEVVIQTNKA